MMKIRRRFALCAGVLLVASCTTQGPIVPVIFRTHPHSLRADAFVAECKDRVGQEPWLVRFRPDWGSGVFVGYLPPETETPHLRRGMAYTEGILTPYAQVAPPDDLFAGQYRTPGNGEEPFLVEGEFTDEEIITLFDFLRGHIAFLSNRQLNEAADDAFYQWQAAKQALRKAPTGQRHAELQKKVEDADYTRRRIVYRYMVPLSQVDGVVIHLEDVEEISKDRSWHLLRPDLADNAVVVTTGNSEIHGDNLYILQTNGLCRIIGETDEYVPPEPNKTQEGIGDSAEPSE